MSDAAVSRTGFDARQSMIRVWLAMTGVWLAFWSAIAALLVASFGTDAALTSLVVLIVAPPLALLAIGFVCRCAVEIVAPESDLRAVEQMEAGAGGTRRLSDRLDGLNQERA